MPEKNLKIAIFHYWLVTWRGGENVLKSVLELYPNADLYTHVYKPELVAEHLPEYKNRIKTTFIHKLPFAAKLYQKYVAFMPFAQEQLDLTEYDLVISFESGPAKNIVTHPNALHICYCHSPMRYIWDMYWLYQKEASKITRLLMKPLAHYLKVCDQLSANRVDYFIANSKYISRRIEKCYRRKSDVIYPMVNLSAFSPTNANKKQEYYVFLGQLITYKSPELVVEAFNTNGKKLIIIGDGELKQKLITSANSNIQIIGKQSQENIQKYLAEARALIFPGEEDFGIVPLEAMASGTPVIAYGRGGATETVIDGVTGKLFKQQTAEALNTTIDAFEKEVFNEKDLTSQAKKFSEAAFQKSFKQFIEEKLSK